MIVTCICGVMVQRHHMRAHAKFHCRAQGGLAKALATTPEPQMGRPCQREGCLRVISTSTPTARYCGPRCRRKVGSLKRAARYTPKQLEPRACARGGCCAVFKPRRIDNRFCSKACQDLEGNWRKRGGARARLMSQCPNPACGKAFVARKGKDFCTERCYEAVRHLERKAANEREEAALSATAERDERDMVPVRLKESYLAAEVERTGRLILAGVERSHALWHSLLTRRAA